jgi:hypothetical protein
MIFQGNYGSGVFSDPGADPTRLYGPVPAAGQTGQGVLLPPMRVGTVISGDAGSEFVLCKLTLGSTTDLVPGQAFQFDKDYNASLLSTSGSVLNQEVAFGQAFAPQTAAGTWYIWLGRAGHLAVKATGAANGFGETTAVAGTVNFAATPTAGTKSISPSSLYAASFTFTATTATGSPYLANVASIADLTLGAAIAGTGIPASTVVGSIAKAGNAWILGMVQSAALTTPQNATANGTAVTVTVSGTLPANIDWPTLAKQN